MDAERKRAEYAMLKKKRSKGDREARSELKEKKERQKEAQRRYGMKMKEKKAGTSNVESPAAVDGGLSQNESISQSGISTPQSSVSFPSPQLGTSHS